MDVLVGQTDVSDADQLGALIVRGGAGQFVQHHAIVEIGSGDLSQKETEYGRYRTCDGTRCSG